jgi:fumarate reductase flavoprotein subunit
LLLTPGFAKELEVYLPPWLLYVNQQGRRFINEATEYSVLATVVKHQAGGECYAIFDEAARAESRSSAAPNWSAERLAHFAASGSLVRAGSLDDLAGRLGVRAPALATTVANYNEHCRAGYDASFFKSANNLKPMATAPYYAARIRPAVVCWTGAGLRIDREARVLNHADQPIAGLYAAGETTGGAFGDCYAGGGASILNALVFGRVAGWNASRLRHS